MGHPTVIHPRLLWDGVAAAPVTDAALVIGSDGRIAWTGPRADLPAGLADGAEIADLPDAALLPGFADAHLHLADDGWTGRRLLAYGITTVRDTGNPAREIVGLRDRQRRGAWCGPRIFAHGPLLDGAEPWWRHVSYAVPEGEPIEPVVDEIVALGLDGVKAYVGLSAEQVARMAVRAREHGVVSSIHCGKCGGIEALAAGVNSLEHMWSVPAPAKGRGWNTVDPDSPHVRDVISRVAGAGAWVVPTLAVMAAAEHGWGPRFERFPGWSEHPMHLRAWLPRLVKRDDWDDARDRRNVEAMRRMAGVAMELYMAGVPMLAGSDAPFVPTGIGFHHELELLVAAGIPAIDVLRMATSDAARFFRASDEYGSLRPGLTADVVAVAGDPFRDITVTRNVVALWQGGRRIDLDRLRAEVEEEILRAERPAVLPGPDEEARAKPQWGIAGST